MLKKEYHCLVAGLPDLIFIGDTAVRDSFAFRQYLESELHHPDFELVKLLFLHFDNDNLLALRLNRPDSFNPMGNYSRIFLEQQLSPENEHPKLPKYMLSFLDWLAKAEIQKMSVEVENVIRELFYEHILQVENKFLSNWFLFELNLKNVLTAFNCKQYNYNPDDHLIKNEWNFNLCSLLKEQLNHPELFEDEIPYHTEIFDIAERELPWIEKEKAVDKIRWDYLDERTFFYYFTIEKILAFVIKLMITERWLYLDKKTGEELLAKFIERFRTGFEFSAEFDLAK